MIRTIKTMSLNKKGLIQMDRGKTNSVFLKAMIAQKKNQILSQLRKEPS